MNDDHRVIKAIDCYGKWHHDNNFIVKGYNEEGDDFEQIWADGADDWQDAVDRITKWADSAGITVLEIEAC